MPVAAALLLAYAAAFVVNLYVLPHNSVLSSLYAVPVLVAAHLLAPRAIALTGLTGVLLYLVNAFLEERPPVVWPVALATLAAVTYLAVLFAHQRQETLRHAQEVEEAQRRLQQFVGMVGHDLAGALTGVLGYAELLARQAPLTAGGTPCRCRAAEAPTGLAVEAVEATARRVRRLIDDLRDASSIGTGHFAVRRAPVDLGRLLRQVVTEQQTVAPDHRITLEAPARLEGSWDEERLSQLFGNLITNAVAYSPSGSEVRVCAREAGDAALVSVADRGVGIAPQFREALFQPYVRLGDERGVKGMGLGLYIARAVAEAHGGRIWVESAPGRGSTFFVSLSRQAMPASEAPPCGRGEATGRARPDAWDGGGTR